MRYTCRQAKIKIGPSRLPPQKAAGSIHSTIQGSLTEKPTVAELDKRPLSDSEPPGPGFRAFSSIHLEPIKPTQSTAASQKVSAEVRFAGIWRGHCPRGKLPELLNGWVSASD